MKVSERYHPTELDHWSWPSECAVESMYWYLSACSNRFHADSKPMQNSVTLNDKKIIKLIVLIKKWYETGIPREDY